VTHGWLLIALIALTAGCVTPYREGERALSLGRYGGALVRLLPSARAVDPHLPVWLPEITLRNLRVGERIEDALSSLLPS
jgi:hypothetical protein